MLYAVHDLLVLDILLLLLQPASQCRPTKENLPNPFPTHIRRRSLITRDLYTMDESCSQSPIQANMTLKGGIEAGFFRKLAEHVAMQLCVELCCEEKGCDVAMMSGKNCYGVQCFSEELCRSIPAKKNVEEPMFISHVTFEGEQSSVVEPTSTNKLQCSAMRMRTGVTLRGGLKSGNFTDVGRVDSMSMCVKLCCVSERCDVALMINKHCFLVSCFSKHQCEMVKALTNQYRPSLAYVLRKTEKVANEKDTSLTALKTRDNQLLCKNSQIFYNSTLKGGYRAGNYTNFGTVANMSACIRLCCGNKDCDAALMLERNCFAVACFDADNCLPVHAKASSSLGSLNPRLTYITSRSEEVATRDHLTADGTCHPGTISYDVSLRGGMKAGNFTPHGKLGSMEACITKCCQISNCSLAMMLNEACFTVICKQDELCEKKQTPTSSKFNPRIAYVFRDKVNIPRKKVSEDHASKERHHKMKHHKKMLLAAQLTSLAASDINNDSSNGNISHVSVNNETTVQNISNFKTDNPSLIDAVLEYLKETKASQAAFIANNSTRSESPTTESFSNQTEDSYFDELLQPSDSPPTIHDTRNLTDFSNGTSAHKLLGLHKANQSEYGKFLQSDVEERTLYFYNNSKNSSHHKKRFPPIQDLSPGRNENSGINMWSRNQSSDANRTLDFSASSLNTSSLRQHRNRTIADKIRVYAKEISRELNTSNSGVDKLLLAFGKSIMSKNATGSTEQTSGKYLPNITDENINQSTNHNISSTQLTNSSIPAYVLNGKSFASNLKLPVSSKQLRNFSSDDSISDHGNATFALRQRIHPSYNLCANGSTSVKLPIENRTRWNKFYWHSPTANVSRQPMQPSYLGNLTKNLKVDQMYMEGNSTGVKVSPDSLHAGDNVSSKSKSNSFASNIYLRNSFLTADSHNNSEYQSANTSSLVSSSESAQEYIKSIINVSTPYDVSAEEVDPLNDSVKFENESANDVDVKENGHLFDSGSTTRSRIADMNISKEAAYNDWNVTKNNTAEAGDSTTNSALVQTLHQMDQVYDNEPRTNSIPIIENISDYDSLSLLDDQSACTDDLNSTSCADVFENMANMSSSTSPSDPSVLPGISSVSEFPTCTNSKILYNVTLKGGLKSGKFRDRGTVDNVNQCVNICCISTTCDVAFMLRKRCFSVECRSQKSCEAIPAKSTIFSPVLCYVLARSYGRD